MLLNSMSIIFGPKYLIHSLIFIINCSEEPMPFSCTECGRGGYNKFTRILYCEERSSYCKDCERFFTPKYNLNKHIENHTGERPLQCSKCDKDLLPRGERTECGRDRYKKCSLLNFSTQVDNLRKHTGEKPHSCTHLGIQYLCNIDPVYLIQTLY